MPAARLRRLALVGDGRSGTPATHGDHRRGGAGSRTGRDRGAGWVPFGERLQPGDLGSATSSPPTRPTSGWCPATPAPASIPRKRTLNPPGGNRVLAAPACCLQRAAMRPPTAGCPASVGLRVRWPDSPAAGAAAAASCCTCRVRWASLSECAPTPCRRRTPASSRWTTAAAPTARRSSSVRPRPLRSCSMSSATSW